MTGVIDHLLGQPVPFVALPCPRARSVRDAAARHRVDLRELVRTDVVITRSGPAYLTVPTGRTIDLALARLAVRDPDARVATHTEVRSFVRGCEVDALPPLSLYLMAPVFVDVAISGLDQVVFPAGSASILVCMQRADLFGEQPVTIAPLVSAAPAIASIVAPSRRIVLTDEELVPMHLREARAVASG